MQITPVKNIFFYNKQTNKFKSLLTFKNHIPKDTISFSGKSQKTAKQKIEALPEESYPSIALRNFILERLEENKEANILDIHLEYYARLLDCETLNEAKELYPEFKEVIDATEIDEKIFGTKGFRKIQEGKLDGLTKDNFSLTAIKLIFGKGISKTEIAEKGYFGIKYSGKIKEILSNLNIEIDQRYAYLLQSEKIKKAWQDDNFKEKQAQKRKEVWQDEEYRKKMRAIQKLNQNKPETKAKKEEKLRIIRQTPEFREKISRISQEHWQNPEYREKLSKIRKEISSTPEARKTMSERSKKLKQDETQQKIAKIVYYASSKAWELHPIAKEIHRQTAKEVPGFSKIMAKIKSGTELDDGEKYVLKKYFSLCRDKAPELKKEIGKLQKEILASWGFYDKNRDLDKIIETYLPK